MVCGDAELEPLRQRVWELRGNQTMFKRGCFVFQYPHGIVKAIMQLTVGLLEMPDCPDVDDSDLLFNVLRILDKARSSSSGQTIPAWPDPPHPSTQ